MNCAEATIENITETTEFLHEYGYSRREEKNDVWSYTLSYISEDSGLAIEFELDCRDSDLFVLVTMLEIGKLPE